MNLRSQKHSWLPIKTGHLDCFPHSWGFWIFLTAGAGCQALWTDNPLARVVFKAHMPFLKIWAMQMCTYVNRHFWGSRQQLAVLFAEHSLAPYPVDGEEPVALPVMPREWQRVPTTSISQLLVPFGRVIKHAWSWKKQQDVYLYKGQNIGIYAWPGWNMKASLTIASNKCFKRG